MPLFEYLCRKCGGVTEFLEKAGAAGEHPCGKCGGLEMEKQLSAFSAKVAPSAPACASGACQPSRACCGGACPMSG